VFNLEINIIIESYDVTFDETAPYLCDVFECTGDKKMEESIFVDEGLKSVDGDEDKPLLPSTSSPELIHASTLEVEAHRATTPFTAAVDVSWIKGKIIFKQGALSYSEGTSTSTDHS
jgi:hypothetical protein